MGKEDTTTGLTPPTRLSPLEVQQKEFRVSRFGGYKMRDVDEFLDQITDTLTALTSEVERLRAGGAAPVVGSPDLDDVARQADEIIARARADATRITAEARAAGTAGAAIGAAGATDRAAVTAFIDRERSFLQSLAGLVQEHAETMKGMAKSARQASAAPGASAPAATGASVPASSATPTTSRAEPAASAAPAEPAAPAAPAPHPAREAADASAATATASATPDATSASASTPAHDEAATPTTGSTADDDADEPTRVPDSESTVRIEEPAPAGARSDGDAEGDRSLRELFWGED